VHSDVSDTLKLQEQFQTELGGGAGVGVKTQGFSFGAVEVEAGATATGELHGLTLSEWQSVFPQPYTDSAKKAQAAFVIGGLLDMAPYAPGLPLLAGTLAQLLPNAGYAVYVDHVANGAGAEWKPLYINEGAKIGPVKLNALDTEMMLRLFGTATDYLLANEYGLSLEQEAGFELNLLTVQPVFEQRIGAYVGQRSAKLKEELFFSKSTGQPVRLELSLTGEGNVSAFNDIELNDVTYRFTVEGSDLETALQRVRNLTGLLAAAKALPTRGLIVGSSAVLQEVNAYLGSIPLSRYEVVVTTKRQLTTVQKFGPTGAFEASLGMGVELAYGREIVIERGYGTLVGLYPTEVYPDRVYGSQPGKTIWDLLNNAAEGAWLIVRDAVNGVARAVGQGVGWTVDILAKTQDNVVRGGAWLLGGSSTTYATAQPVAGPLVVTDALTVTATSWVPQAGSALNSRLLSASAETFAIGGVYQFEPYTLTLTPPATLVLTYTQEAVGTANPTQFKLYRWRPEENSWQPLNAIHDTVARAMTTTIGQLGTFVIGYDNAPPVVTLLQPGSVVTETHFPQFDALIVDRYLLNL